MAGPTQTALRSMMGKRPPNLTVTEDTHKNCGTCVHWSDKGVCRLYSYPTAQNQVSDSWEPKPT